MSVKQYEIEDKYIQEVLNQFGKYQIDRLKENIERLKLVNQGILLNSV